MDDINRIAKTDPTAKGDAFLEALQGKLLSSAGMISSEDTEIERAIGKSIEQLKLGNESSKKRIESEYGREVGYETEKIGLDVTESREGGRGFALNIGALREITKTGDKRLNDLWQRKEELILAGDAETAKQVSGLMLKEMELQQEARQRTFTNLLGMANFGIARNQEARLARAQNFAERDAISKVALTYGLTINENDTIDTITARAMPFASEKQRLEISKMKAEINRANAEASKAMREGNSSSLDGLTASVLASQARRDVNSLAVLEEKIKDPNELAKIYKEMNAQSTRDLATASERAATLRANGGSRTAVRKALESDPNFIVSADDVTRIVEDVFSKKVEKKKDDGTKRASIFDNNRKPLKTIFSDVKDPFAGLFGN